MRIISINKTLAAVTIVAVSAAGCGSYDRHREARSLVARSDVAFQRAVGEYEKLIASSSAPDELYMELGNLYFRRGDNERAAETLKKSSLPAAQENRAIALCLAGDATGALEIFNRLSPGDDEGRYYQGLTCEKLNLFDQALKLYRQIQSSGYKGKADARAQTIERQAGMRVITAVDPAVGTIIAHAPPDDAYPQAGALILASDEAMEVSDHGTSVSTMRYIIKILNERGKEDFSEAHIAYDSTFEKVELEYARTIKPDGTVVDVGTRHVRDVSRYMNFPLYSNARVRIISFPEVAAGSVIEYKVRLYNNELINKEHVVFGYGLKSREPIIDEKFSLSIPGNKKVNFKVINAAYNDCEAEFQPSKEDAGAHVVYRWHFNRVPQIVPEQNMPPDMEINPTMLVSTFGSWQEIYAWWWSLAKDKISADDEIRRAVADLTAGARTDEDKVRAIYHFCAQKIRYVAVEYGQAGYEPHKAGDILKNKYGDCKDQAILLVTMMRQAGIKAWPVLIATREYYNLNEDFPAALFNHCIAAVELGAKIVFLDPTAETCSFGDLPGDDQRRRVLLCKDDGYLIRETPLYPADHNRSLQELSIDLNPDGSVSGRRTVSTYGLYDQGQRYWLLYTMPEVIRETLNGRIQQVSIGAVLDEYTMEHAQDLNRPVVVRYTFHGPEYGMNAGPLRILPQLASIDAAVAAKDTRIYPVDFKTLIMNEYIFEIALPPGFKVQYMPVGISRQSPWLDCEVSYEQNGQRIRVRQVNTVKTTAVTPQEYPAFKAFIRRLGKDVKESIVLSRTK